MRLHLDRDTEHPAGLSWNLPYCQVVRNALEGAGACAKVRSLEGREMELTIETVMNRYRALYGVPDLQDRLAIEDANLPFIIHQKVTIVLEVLAKARLNCYGYLSNMIGILTKIWNLFPIYPTKTVNLHIGSGRRFFSLSPFRTI